jgi:hypothetical protein
VLSRGSHFHQQSCGTSCEYQAGGLLSAYLSTPVLCSPNGDQSAKEPTAIVLRAHDDAVDAVAISPDSHANPFLFGIVARPGEELRRSLRNFAHDRSTPDPLNKRFPVGLMN